MLFLSKSSYRIVIGRTVERCRSAAIAVIRHSPFCDIPWHYRKNLPFSVARHAPRPKCLGETLPVHPYAARNTQFHMRPKVLACKSTPRCKATFTPAQGQRIHPIQRIDDFSFECTGQRPMLSVRLPLSFCAGNGHIKMIRFVSLHRVASRYSCFYFFSSAKIGTRTALGFVVPGQHTQLPTRAFRPACQLSITSAFTPLVNTSSSDHRHGYQPGRVLCHGRSS